MEVLPHEIPNALLEEGDIVAVEGHANAYEIGRAALISREATGFAYQNHLFRIRLLEDAKLNRLFLLGVLNSERVRRHWVATCNTSSGLNTINHRGLRRLLIQRPQEEEQEEIARLLANSDETTAACEAEILALNRLRRSLLQNLLTGRVRVRI
jgi:type I restriction enzyme S subunit